MKEYDTLFPYEQPREPQVDGMETVGRAAEHAGYVAMEGACGTGKTLTALVPDIEYVRRPETDASTVFITTSVRQQMAAFQDEVCMINQQLPDDTRPISAVTLVSLPSVHPFVEQGVIESNAYSQIDSLRSAARELATTEAYDYSYADLVKHAKDQSDSDSTYAYDDAIPTLAGLGYDPYYAKYRATFAELEDDEDVARNLPFNTNHVGLLDADDIRSICSSVGICPHSVMRLAIEHVDLVIGNYNHVFDPTTAARFTSPIMSDETLLILDEAHNLVPRVREFLSKQMSVRSLGAAAREAREIAVLDELAEYDTGTVRKIIGGATQSGAGSPYEQLEQRVRTVLQSNESVVTSADGIISARSEVSTLLERVDVERSTLRNWATYISDFADAVDRLLSDERLQDDQSIQLRDPQNPAEDQLSKWSGLHEHSELMARSGLFGSAIAEARDIVTKTAQTPRSHANSVGEVLTDWDQQDHVRYYRSIDIEDRTQQTDDLDYAWQDDYKAHITLNNCIPRDEIADILSTFRSAVLMSATLEPLDIYKYTTGLSKLADAGRPVFERTYGLTFPERNRATLSVPAHKFKYGNRQSAFVRGKPNTSNDTREQYSDLILDFAAEVSGNSMVVMPSYAEAEWAGEILKRSYEFDASDVYVDESSRNSETEQMKRAFFESDGAVLVTGARGTLIEGVDYIDDRLTGMLVCGVPITNTNSDYKRAIQAAYDELFDDGDGFTLAFTIPAVRKTRQALGRVIRTNTDIGVRVLADERYTKSGRWDSVGEYLGVSEQADAEIIAPEDIKHRLDAFYTMHDR